MEKEIQIFDVQNDEIVLWDLQYLIDSVNEQKEFIYGGLNDGWAFEPVTEENWASEFVEFMDDTFWELVDADKLIQRQRMHQLAKEIGIPIVIEKIPNEPKQSSDDSISGDVRKL